MKKILIVKGRCNLGLSIILRTSAQKCDFRRHLQHLIKYQDIDEILICSGYIQENLWNYSITEDQILDLLSNHPNKDSIQIKTVAGKFDKDYLDKWETAYREFITKLCENDINIIPFVTKNRNWHAKILILRRNNTSVAGIIGSSNLTRPAYGEPYSSFNFECDVVLWSSSDNDICNYMNNFYFKGYDGQDPFSAIRAILDPSICQIDEQRRLDELYDDIFNKNEISRYTFE